jgi:CheY-like chemotaxis protein
MPAVWHERCGIVNRTVVPLAGIILAPVIDDPHRGAALHGGAQTFKHRRVVERVGAPACFFLCVIGPMYGKAHQAVTIRFIHIDAKEHDVGAGDGLRELLGQALALQGYQVLTAASVQEAETVKQWQSTVGLGLVITDIHLTATSRVQEGYELYQRRTAVEPALPFLLIGGDPCSRTLPAIQTGAVRFLAKPFPVHTFLSTVQTLISEASAQVR